MIGWDYTVKASAEAEFDSKYTYYCGCRYVKGEPNCVHHGDPPPRYPPPPEDKEAKI